MVIITNVTSTLPIIVKLHAENGKVISTLRNIVQNKVGINNVDSTLIDIVNFNAEAQSVVLTLI